MCTTPKRSCTYFDLFSRIAAFITMRPLLIIPCVGCCVLLLGASSSLHLRDAEASVASGSPDSSDSVRHSTVSPESSPLSTAAAAALSAPSSTTGRQPQILPTVAAVPLDPTPEPTTASDRGPFSAIGALLLSLVPGISSINELFMPRPQPAPQTAETSVANEILTGSIELPALGDIFAETDRARPDTGATRSTTKPPVAFTAASTGRPPVARSTGTDTHRLRVRRLQNSRQNLPSAAKRKDEDQTVHDEVKDDEDRPGSKEDAGEKDREKSGSGRLAEMKSEDASTREDPELVKSETSTTEGNNDGSYAADDTRSKGKKRSNETLELADPTARPAGSTSSAIEKERRNLEESAGATGATGVSKKDKNHSGEKAKASLILPIARIFQQTSADIVLPGKQALSKKDKDHSSEDAKVSPLLPIARISQQTSADIVPSGKQADSARKSAVSSPVRNARPRMSYYGGGPTFSPPYAFGGMPTQTAAIAPVTVVVPPAPVQMIQAQPVQMVQVQPVQTMQMIQTQPVQMVQTQPMQMIQTQPMQMIQTQPVQMVQAQPMQMVQSTAVAVQPTAVAVEPAAATMQTAVPVQLAATPVAAASPAVAMAPAGAVATPMVNTAGSTVPVLPATLTGAAVI